MPDPTMNRIDGLRGWRYGEVLLVRHEAGSFSAEVWNTMGFNECPQAAWDELDAGEIAAERGATLALMNGPRHWVLDAIESSIRQSAPTTKFGTLEMFQAAVVDFGATPPSPVPYAERFVARDTVFEWAAGTPLHELTSPTGQVYVMQAFALYVDPTLSIDELAGLAERLELPEGWMFETRVTDRPLRLLSDDNGIATVIQDELANPYQRVDRTD